jgi:hypothetical protein
VIALAESFPKISSLRPNAWFGIDWFWSSSSTASDETQAVYVAFTNGFVSSTGKSSGYYARCVRGGPMARPPRFTRDTGVASQPVVIDGWTGLEWQGCLRGRTGDDCESGGDALCTLQVAMDYCESLSWGGHDDWRLPSVVELTSIGDSRRALLPYFDTLVFPNTSSPPFWSSSSVITFNPTSAWHVFNIAGIDLKTTSRSTRCVRGGPWD